MIRKLLDCFDGRDKAYAAALFVLMVFAAAFEAIGTALVFPFIALINNPDLVRQHQLLATLYVRSGVTSPQQFLIWSGLVLIGVSVVKSAYLTLVYYLQYRFIFTRQVTLATRLFSGYMGSPYAAHVQRNSAELLRNVNSEVLWIFSGVLVPGASIVIEALVILALLGMLMLVEPLPALGAAAIVGALAVAVLRPLRRATTAAGRRQQTENAAMIRWINQGLGGLKEAKVLGREAFFVQAYRRSSAAYARSMLFLRTTSDIPRLAIEGMTVAGMLLVVVAFLVRGRDMQLILPTLGVFALAAIRMMPSLNRIVSALTLIRYYTPSIELVHHDLREFERAARAAAPPPSGERRPLVFDDVLALEDVSYQYPGAPARALKNVSLTIRRGQSVAFVGPSGAGKTTIVNVILGLLVPTAGRVMVNGTDILTDAAAWQRTIGYIPQPVYLCDDTIRQNVAFGIEASSIDDGRVRRALRAAQLEDLVAALPDGLASVVGENGVKISAGQRQRIGIARALYHDPPVLVLDEATSALDYETEREITRTITAMSGGKTVIIVAHRLTTVRSCDALFFLKDGCLTASASYDAMLATNAEFRRMVSATQAAS